MDIDKEREGGDEFEARTTTKRDFLAKVMEAAINQSINQFLHIIYFHGDVGCRSLFPLFLPSSFPCFCSRKNLFKRC